MNRIIPKKLKKGDEIRIIAPSRSINVLSEDTINRATKRLEDLGLIVTFGKNVNKVFNEEYGCASIEDRVSDLHDAFKDKNVKVILAAIGGFNINQLLDYIDYDLIKNNPKIICGYSDITALTNAIYAKAGLVTYSGPAYSSFGMKKGFEYTLDYFKKMFFEDEDIEITSSDSWSDDAWYIDQENRTFNKNEGMTVINKGSAEGIIVGGNLCTLNLLQGTEYMPELNNTILFIEDDDLVGDEYLREFDRDFVSLLQCYKGKKLNGIVVGRAQINSKMNIDKWKILFENKNLKDIPIIINANFGHTFPMITFPVGGQAIIDNGKIVIKK